MINAVDLWCMIILRLCFKILLIISALSVKAQLIINEVSQGASGAKEYVEFVVAGTPDCVASCVDLRGWIIDDNNGWYGMGTNTGIAPGCIRFSNATQWACVKIGAIILVYNDNDVNPLIPPDDPTDANGDCIFILPVSSGLFERNTTQPSSSTSPSYNGLTFTPGGTWSVIGMRNAGDAIHTVAPSNLNNAFHSVGWGDNSGTHIYFSGSAAGRVYYFGNSVNNDPFNQNNWIDTDAGTPAETPGAPNNAANTTWIQSMSNNCQPFTGITAEITGNTEICAGEGTTLSVISSGNTYLWSNGATTQSIEVILIANAQYSVTVTQGSCVASDTVAVTVNQFPAANAGNNVSICLGDSVLLTATGGSTYLWSNGANTSNTMVAPIVSTTYSVTVSDNGCEATDNVTVTVNALPNVSAGNDVSICLGDDVTLTATGAVQYSWSNGESTASITVSPSTTTDYVVTGFNAANCSASDTITIIVGTVLQAQVSGNTTICEGDSTTLTVTGGSIFLWNTGATTASIKVSPSESTTYSVTATGNSGCADTIDVALIVHPKPQLINWQNFIAVCIGQSVAFNLNENYTYQWSNGLTASAWNFSPQSDTSLQVIFTNTFGCSNEESVIISVNTSPFQISATSEPQQLCPSLRDLTIVITDFPQENYTYNLYQNNVLIAQNDSGKFFGLQGLYTIEVVNESGCMISEDILLLFQGEPFSALDITHPSCFGFADGSIFIFGCCGIGFSLDGENFGANLFENLPAGNYNVYAKDYCNNDSVFVYNNITLTQPAPATINAPDEIIYVIGTTKGFNIEVTPSDYYIVSIEPSTGLNCNDCSNPIISGVEEDITYIITTTNGSCTIYDTIRVRAIEEERIIFPTAFTPDGDGLNDFFKPSIGGQVSSYEMKIFNRWGELIFQTPNTATGWDGYYKGKLQPTGTFAWYCRYRTFPDNLERIKSGQVTLLR